MQTLLPEMEKLGIANPREVDLATLKTRLAREPADAFSTIILPPLIGCG
jgi:hypothetical protein